MFGQPVLRMNPAMVAHFRRLEADATARRGSSVAHPSAGPMSGPPEPTPRLVRGKGALRPEDADAPDDEFGV